MKYLLILLLTFSCPSFSCVVLQDKYDSDAYVKAQKADKDPIVEAIEVYVPARSEEYEASYSYIYLMQGDDLVIASSTKVRQALIPKVLPKDIEFKAIYLSVQEKYKTEVEFEVHYVKPSGPRELTNCSKIKRYRLSELKSL
ncbi:hypothetical protein ACUR5C_15080 [Aliikangiella sp. IMCC44653]